MIPFKPYRLPRISNMSAYRTFTPELASAFVRPRGSVWAVLLPRKSQRYQIYSYDRGARVFDANGGPTPDLMQSDKGMALLRFADRLPKNTVVEVYANDSQVVLSDVLYFVGKDVRGFAFEDRLAAYWFLPPEYRSIHFFNESNLDKLDANLYFPDIGKILFKPNFVSYPRESSKQVFNWTILGRPEVVFEDQGNVSGDSIRAPRNESIRTLGA